MFFNYSLIAERFKPKRNYDAHPSIHWTSYSVVESCIKLRISSPLGRALSLILSQSFEVEFGRQTIKTGQQCFAIKKFISTNGSTSVAKLGDLLHFGQLFKPLATSILPKLLTFLGNFCKGVKIFDFF